MTYKKLFKIHSKHTFQLTGHNATPEAFQHHNIFKCTDHNVMLGA